LKQKNNPTTTNGIQGGYYSHRLGKQKVQDYQFLATLHKDGLFYKKFNASFALGAEAWRRRDYDLWAQNNRKWANPYIWAFSNYDLEGNKAI
jgi:iron complex outermembrane receptor protein